MKYVFLFTAIISIVAVVLICVFLFANGVPAMKEIGFANFLGGTKWKPGNGLYGIFPMILGSIYVTGGALIIGVPIGILMSIFMARFCPLICWLESLLLFMDSSDWLLWFRLSGSISKAMDRAF